MEENKLIELKGITKRFDGVTVLENINLYIRKNEFVTLLGPSGCGKTTTLRIIGGFETADEGTLLFGGQDISALPPYRRRINTVFQRYALFPHMNVFENIAFGLKIKKLAVTDITSRVEQMLHLVNLEGYQKRKVESLSGGQQQRVAIARALVNEPEVLLLDEPLAALDLKLRKDMQLELKNMQKKLGITFVFVTHDQEEALTMSDTVVVMKDGVIQQIGTPEMIYNEPKNAFVADFIGESNIVHGIMPHDRTVLFGGSVFECVDKGFKPGEAVDVVVRPEDIYLVEPERGMLAGRVISNIFKGVHYEMVVRCGDKEWMVQDTTSRAVDEDTGLFVRPGDIHIMHRRGTAGATNIVEGTVENDLTLSAAGAEFALVCEGFSPGDRVDFAVRPEDIQITEATQGDALTGDVISCIFTGAVYEVIVACPEFNWRVASDLPVDENSEVGLVIPPASIFLMKKSAAGHGKNRLKGTVEKENLNLLTGQFAAAGRPDGAYFITVDPRCVFLVDTGRGQFNGEITECLYCGVYYQVVLRANGTALKCYTHEEYEPGEQTGVYIHPDDLVYTEGA